MHTVTIAPSVLASDFSRLGQEVSAMEAAGADLIHLDVMDGQFVPNLSFGAPVIKGIRRATTLPFDVHLMIQNPLRYIGDFADAGADSITFHLESADDTGTTLESIRARGIKAALSIKPGTPVEALEPYLNRVDMILIMTVEPGFGGQKFMPEMLPKIAWLREQREKNRRGFSIQVDGGIDNRTAPLVCLSGADCLVAGSALFRQPDYAEAIRALRAACGA